MAYDGEVLDACGKIQMDFSEAYAVAVSGASWNKCGHLLIYAAKGGGYYFHVAEIRGYPRYMNNPGYQRYLKEQGKTELVRKRLDLPNPAGSVLFIEKVLSEKWTWGGIPNNCVSFVEEVIAAGGGTWSSTSNCPTVATADTIEQRMQQFYNRMINEISRAYGVPSFGR